MSDQKRTFLAIILSAIVIFAWQFYFAPKQLASDSSETIVTSAPVVSEKFSNNATIGALPTTTVSTEDNKVAPLETFTISNKDTSYEFASDFSIRRTESGEDLKQTFSTIINETAPLISISILEEAVLRPLSFFVTRLSESSYQLNDNIRGVRVSLELDTKGRLNYTIESQTPYKYQVALNASAATVGQNFSTYLYYGNDIERMIIGKDDKASEESVKWLGIDHDYHLLSMVFNEKIPTKIDIGTTGYATFKIVEPQQKFSGFFIFKKKDYDELKLLENQLHLAVDFGIFGVVAVPILKGLKLFYKFFPNFGIAIILMTLLIRALTFPLQYKSYQSMKKMQLVQPELNKLKEKYKDDSQALQRETMAAFKRAGANPMGGCLPLLLQFPIFIAFYKVLSAAVELVDAPFYGWIHDLSAKDPYYIYPIAMTLSMVAQQKFMPQTTTDEMQKKIMLFMPLFFGFIMKDLPSGLVIYMFVSTILGITQQYFQNKYAK